MLFTRQNSCKSWYKILRQTKESERSCRMQFFRRCYCVWHKVGGKKSQNHLWFVHFNLILTLMASQRQRGNVMKCPPIAFGLLMPFEGQLKHQLSFLVAKGTKYSKQRNCSPLAYCSIFSFLLLIASCLLRSQTCGWPLNSRHVFVWPCTCAPEYVHARMCVVITSMSNCSMCSLCVLSCYDIFSCSPHWLPVIEAEKWTFVSPSWQIVCALPLRLTLFRLSLTVSILSVFLISKKIPLPLPISVFICLDFPILLCKIIINCDCFFSFSLSLAAKVVGRSCVTC